MKFKSKKYKKRINTNAYNHASRKNKKVRISRSRKYKRVTKRYYKNNTHKRNKIQNGGDISQNLLALMKPGTFLISYKKISINGRPTPDSLFHKSSLFTVQFIEEKLVNPNGKLFCLKMVRNDSKSFTVYFRVVSMFKGSVIIFYLSGKEIADLYNNLKEKEKAEAEAKAEEAAAKEEVAEKKEIIDKLNMKLASQLEFDKKGLLKFLTITDDTGVDTYNFYTTDSTQFFRDLSSMRDCFT